MRRMLPLCGIISAVAWLVAACATVPPLSPAGVALPPTPAAAQGPAAAQTPMPAAVAGTVEAPPPSAPPPDAAGPILAEMEDARRAFEKADYGKALDLSLRLTAKLPSHPYPWRLLGLSYLRNGQRILAAEALKKCVAILPDDTASHASLASLALDSDNLDEGLEHMAALYRVSPTAEAANGLAYIMIRKGRLDTAQVLLENARAQFPSDTVVLNNAAVVLDAMGHTSQALSLLKGTPDTNPRVLATRAMLNLKEGLLDEAARDLEASLSSSPSPEGSLLAGILLVQRSRLEEAAAAFREFIALNPFRSEGYINLGLTLRRLGRFVDAEAVYREGLEKTGAADLYLNLGTLYELFRADIPRALENYRAYAAMGGAGAQRVQGWIDYLSTPRPETGASGGEAP